MQFLNLNDFLPQVTGHGQVTLDGDNSVTKREKGERSSFEENEKCVGWSSWVCR